METLDRLALSAALFADFVGNLAHLNLSPRLCLALALSFSCGEDAEQRYAGLNVATASAPDGLSYRIRFLNPPWKNSQRDALAAGADTDVELRGKNDQVFIAGTAIVLEIDREAVVVDTRFSQPKYRLEATLLDCDLPLADDESCAKSIAVADNLARTAQGETSLYEGSIKSGTNDFDQKYFELLTRSIESRRNKRIAFFETPDPQRYLRVYIEGNPRLDEPEVDHMLNAIEIFEDSSRAATADGGDKP